MPEKEIIKFLNRDESRNSQASEEKIRELAVNRDEARSGMENPPEEREDKKND